MKISHLPIAILVALALCGQTKPNLPPAATIKIDFDQHIKPMLVTKCYGCHNAEVQQAGLRLDRRQQALRGGDYGPVIIVGDSAASKLVRRLVNGDGGLRMPPTEALTNEEIGLFRAWIDQGAEFRTEVKEDPPPPPLEPKVVGFLSAIRNRDLKVVQAALSTNPALAKAMDQNKSTALHFAAALGTIDIMKALIDKGADINAKNRRHSTPIFWALHDEERVRLLIDKGANVNARLIEGNSLIYQAAGLGDSTRIVQLLLDKGADPNVPSATKQTPLMVTAGRGNVEAMKLMLAKGANPKATNAAGSNALTPAATGGNPAAIALLLEKGADPNAATKRGATALDSAATEGYEASIRLLVEAGAKVNTQDERGHSPLMLAAASEVIPVGAVKYLLSKGADTKLKGEYDDTAATLAARRGDTEVTRLLGASLSERQAVAKPVNDVALNTPRKAVEKALPMLEKQSFNFIRIAGCNSCHAQDLPSTAAGLARSRGIPAPKEFPQLPLSLTGTSSDRVMDQAAGGVASIGWELYDLHMNGKPQDDYTDAVSIYLRSMQAADGHWKAANGRRPPMNTGEFQAAALAIYALKHYTPAASQAESDKSIARARVWLEKQSPQSSQDRAFHLMALVWSGSSADHIRRAARVLTDMQRPEGGWSQFPSLGADSYATGQALYALHTAGMPAKDAVYRKGVSYLLRTQAADGTWMVKSRAIWVQPYFESGFPYGTDQFISAAGTAWASIALSVAEEPSRTVANR